MELNIANKIIEFIIRYPKNIENIIIMTTEEKVRHWIKISDKEFE